MRKIACNRLCTGAYVQMHANYSYLAVYRSRSALFIKDMRTASHPYLFDGRKNIHPITIHIYIDFMLDYHHNDKEDDKEASFFTTSRFGKKYLAFLAYVRSF